jgi:hypothetical protein
MAATIRIAEESRDNLLYLRRELSVRFQKDFTMSDTVRYLIQGYSPKHPEITKALSEIINRKGELL